MGAALLLLHIQPTKESHNYSRFLQLSQGHQQSQAVFSLSQITSLVSALSIAMCP